MEDIRIFEFYIESKKYPKGITLQEAAISTTQAEEKIRKDFEDINDDISYIKFKNIIK